MKCYSWNVNGIRACSKKGFFEFLETYQPDVLGLQETKANFEDLEPALQNPLGYHSVYVSAEKKGYSGVALLTKEKPLAVHEGLEIPRFDSEGRTVIAEYPSVTVINAYFPNGQRDQERLSYKLDFYDAIFKYCDDLVNQGQNILLMGDYNTAHKAIDLARPKENETTSGFLPVEREWIDNIIDRGYVDTFREFNQEPEQYSWWTYRMGARKRNVGWRIDYVFVNNSLTKNLKNAFICQEVMGSDHCPVGVELDFNG